MPVPTFVSFAQNGEDVVLWRALQGVSLGRYVEVGANHPRQDSATRAFYDRGWHGITIEPVGQLADLQRAERPRDHFVQAVVAAEPVEVVLHVFPDTGLSTIVDSIADDHALAGLEHRDETVLARRLDDILDEYWQPSEEIHFMLVDVEGAERSVLASVDLRRWRPWVLVVESTAPNSTRQTHTEWENLVLAAGYTPCLFDGLSRFYVAEEHSARLGAALSYPACPLDGFVRVDLVEASARADQAEARADQAETRADQAETRADQAETRADQAEVRASEFERAREAATEGLIRWRTAALYRWAHAASPGTSAEMERLRRRSAELEVEVHALRTSTSWRVTKPLRVAGRLKRRGR